MAEKSINFILDGNPSTITVGATIKREDLYGKQKKSVEKGQPLEKVILSPEGHIYLPSEFTNQRLDSEGTLAESAVTCAEDGTPLPVEASSFKTERELKPASYSELAHLKVESVIPAQTTLGPGLYRGAYTYRDSANLLDAILNVTPDGKAFLLIGTITESPALGKGETYNFFDEDEEEAEESEDLSFSMF